MLTIALSLLAAASCGPKPTAPPIPPAPAAGKPKQNLFILLPSEGGGPSRIRVSNQAGSRELSEPFGTVRVESAAEAPSTPFVMDQHEVRRQWGALIDSAPLAAVQFNLYFVQARDELTMESAALIPEVLRAIRERRSTDTSLIGHTDTTDDAAANYRLGLRRAERMAQILQAQGVDPSILSIASHGEYDLLVKTPDGVAEPRNRRVEISVR